MNKRLWGNVLAVVPSAEGWQPQAAGVCGYYNRRVRLAKASLRDCGDIIFHPPVPHCVQNHLPQVRLRACGP